jgi:hypothetical protein
MRRPILVAAALAAAVPSFAQAAGGTGTGTGTGNGGLTLALAAAAGLSGFSQTRSRTVSFNSSTGQTTTRTVRQASFDTASGGFGSVSSFRSVTVDTAGKTVSSINNSSASFHAGSPATVVSVPAAIVAFPSGQVAVVSRATVLSGGAVVAGSSTGVLAPGATFTTIAVTGTPGPTVLRSAIRGTLPGADAEVFVVSGTLIR